MVTLIAIDGDYLNRALRKKAQSLAKIGEGLPETVGKPRLRIDYTKLANLLADPLDHFHEDVILNYYTTQQKTDSDKLMGRVAKYWPERGYGFISGVNGISYFFHNRDIVNKRELRIKREERYPHPTSREFLKRIKGKIVTFDAEENEGKHRALDVHIERGNAVDKFYQLRKEPFLAMLEGAGYSIIRCHGTSSRKGKDKDVGCRIYYDAMRELQDSEDRLVLVSDDPVFSDLISGLQEDEVRTIVAAFDSRRSEELASNADDMLSLDSHLDDIQFEYDAEEESILSP